MPVDFENKQVLHKGLNADLGSMEPKKEESKEGTKITIVIRNEHRKPLADF